MIGAHVTSAERMLFRRLAEAGGHYKFRPDGSGAAYAACNRDVVPLLQSAESQGLIAMDRRRSRTIGLRSSGTYGSVAATLTEAGRAALV
jgi:hypothetical protein